MTHRPLTVAVVGATGVVGRTMIQVIYEREFPVGELRLLASGRSAGRTVSVDGRTHEILENGLPLGMMDAAEYGQIEEPLRPGDRFLLYTDGLADATNPAGDYFDVERVKAEIEGTAGLSVERAADSILDRTRKWTAGVAGDDMTFVLVDCL